MNGCEDEHDNVCLLFVCCVSGLNDGWMFCVNDCMDGEDERDNVCLCCSEGTFPVND